MGELLLMVKERKHFRYMDVLNVLSCFAVVVLHCTTVVYVNQGDVQWFVSIALQSLLCLPFRSSL